VKEQAAHVVIETARVRVSVALEGGACAWDILREGSWHRVISDRKTQAYNFDWWDSRVYHYVERRRDEIYVGLGERARSLDRAQQSYEMRNIDAMGHGPALQAHSVLRDVAAADVDGLRPVLRHARRSPLRHHVERQQRVRDLDAACDRARLRQAVPRASGKGARRQSTREVYLPAGSRWVSYWSGEAFDGGQSVTPPAPFVTPLNIAGQHFGRPADERAFIALPYAGTGTAQGSSKTTARPTHAGCQCRQNQPRNMRSESTQQRVRKLRCRTEKLRQL
jgi:hypothetical protein